MALPHPWPSLVLATAIVAAYTAVVWWLCHPAVKAFVRISRRPRRPD
jgi:hypothetical protein